MATETTNKIQETEVDKFVIYKWIASTALPLLIYFLFPGDVNVRIFLALTSWAILTWLFALIPDGFVGLLLPILYILAGIAQPAEAFAPWSTIIPWMVLAGMIIGAAMIHTGFAKRIAYYSILRTGGSFLGLAIGLTISGIILALIIPSIMARVAIMAPIAVGLCQALNFKPKTREATVVMLIAFFTTVCTAYSYVTGAEQFLLAQTMMGQVTGAPFTWLQWALYNFIPGIIWTVMALILVLLILRPKVQTSGNIKQEIESSYKEMGPVSASEKKLLLLVLIIITAFITQPLHHLQPAWLMVLVTTLFFLPSFKLIDTKKLVSMNIWILFYIAGSMAIGFVSNASGATKWISDLMLPFFESQGAGLGMLLIANIFGILANFIITPLGAVAAFTMPLTQMSVAAGITPEPVVFSFLYGLDIYVFPYEYALLLYFFAFGYINLQDTIKVLSVRMILSLLFVAIVLYPYWKLTGLL